MRKINMSVYIERPIEEVFSAFTDVRTQPQWDPNLLEGHHEPDAPAQLGTKITEVRKFMGRVSENTSELVEFEANRKIVRTGTDGSMTLTGIITFTETGSGTHVDWEWVLEMAGWLSPAALLMAPQLKKSAEPILGNLKQLLENDAFQPLN
ncbi:MAG: SRPBCC family protein [Chloroflexota bacterium]